jgi:hypothetical protein
MEIRFSPPMRFFGQNTLLRFFEPIWLTADTARKFL